MLMPRSKRTTRKTTVKAPKMIKRVEEETIAPQSFHETFPLTLRHLKSKEKKVCYFQCEEHMDKYIQRSGMKKREYKIEDTKPKDES